MYFSHRWHTELKCSFKNEIAFVIYIGSVIYKYMTISEEVQPANGSFHAHSPNRIRRDLSNFFLNWCVCKRAPSDMVAQRVFLC
jgi:hypothetical protein